MFVIYLIIGSFRVGNIPPMSRRSGGTKSFSVVIQNFLGHLTTV
jgi:hypothetical protein